MDKDLLSAASTWDTSSQGQSPRIELPGFEDGDNMSKDIPAAATSSQGQDLRIQLPDKSGPRSSQIVQMPPGGDNRWLSKQSDASSLCSTGPSQAFHHVSAKRRKRSASISQKLPLDLVRLILEHLDQTTYRKAIATAFVFLRASLSTCCCEEIGPRRIGTLVATLIESNKGGYLRVAAPAQARSPWLESAALMLQRYLCLACESGWVRAVACRGGAIVVIRDRGATEVKIMKPFDRITIKQLVPASQAEAADLVSVGIEPVSDDEFRLLMLFRGMNKCMVLKIFDSTTKSWELKELICPFSLSPSQKISAVAVYSGGSFHVLDHSSNKILIFNSDLLDKISLPVDEINSPISLKNNTLACTRRGELTWVFLDGSSAIFFVHTGSDWVPRWRRRIPDNIPQHLNTCEIIGHSESGLVIFRCGVQVFSMDVEDGHVSAMKECRTGINRCLSFEIWHSLADHRV